jgi:hypothetical protein
MRPKGTGGMRPSATSVWGLKCVCARLLSVCESCERVWWSLMCERRVCLVYQGREMRLMHVRVFLLSVWSSIAQAALGRLQVLIYVLLYLLLYATERAERAAEEAAEAFLVTALLKLLNFFATWTFLLPFRIQYYSWALLLVACKMDAYISTLNIKLRSFYALTEGGMTVIKQPLQVFCCCCYYFLLHLSHRTRVLKEKNVYLGTIFLRYTRSLFEKRSSAGSSNRHVRTI